MGVAIADPTETALARRDLVVDPPVGDQVRDDQAMEGHAATTRQADQLAESQHPVPIDHVETTLPATTAHHAAIQQATGIAGHHAPTTAPIEMTGRHAPIVMTAPSALIAAIAQLVPSATTVRDAQNAADSATAVHATMDHPRSACGPKAELRPAATATQANASQKRIAIPSASARFVRTTRHPRFPRESRPKCLTALLSMS